MKAKFNLPAVLVCGLALVFLPHFSKGQNASPHAPPREGKVAADLSKPFTHFRVGNRNVKSIYAEGTVVWVGTSGGVVRYDTKTEAYKLYDNKNGLLSNGVFWVGRLRGRITVG